MDNLGGLDFIPAGANKGKKEFLAESGLRGNKTRPPGVYHHEHVHTYGAGLPPFSVGSRRPPFDGQNVTGPRPAQANREERIDEQQEEG